MENNNYYWIAIMIIIGAVIGVGIVMWKIYDYGQEENRIEVEAKEHAAKDKAELESLLKRWKKSEELILLTSYSTRGEFNVLYVIGTIKNQSDATYSYVQVEINLYDKSGAQIGSTMDNINNLEAGSIWKFKAVVLQDNTASYKIKEITGF